MCKTAVIPAPVKAAVHELYGDETVSGKIIISHTHTWDGGFICCNGYPGSESEFEHDLTQMMTILYDIAHILGASRTEVFPIGNSFFEHWQDVTDQPLSKKISKCLRENGADRKTAVSLDIHHELVRLFVSGAFNYLIGCAFLINKNAVIIPTHNFEFHTYCPGYESMIKEIAAGYPFAGIYT